MRRSLFLPLLVVTAIVTGCGKRSGNQPNSAAESPSNQDPPIGSTLPGTPQTSSTQVAPEAAPANADMTEALAQMTRALRRLTFERRRMPTNIEEVLSSGYVAQRVAPPPGKKFAINPKTAEVILVNR